MACLPPIEASPPGAGTGVDRAVLKALVRLASLVTGAHDALATVEAVAETARELLGAASLSVSSRDDDGRALVTLVNVGELGHGEVRWPTDERYELDTYPQAVRALQPGRHRVALTRVGDPAADGAEVALLLRLGKAASLNAPILVDGLLWGELWASRRADQPPFDACTSELSEVVAGLISAGLAQAAAWQQLQALASTDPLTGLANRRAFDERLDELLEGPVPAPGFALVLGDVDGLKRVNDSLGHPAGDEALRAVADAGAAAVRDVPGGVAARLGGDEYGLLVPGVDAAGAFAVAAAWCAACDAGPYGTSLSAGVLVVTEGTHLAASVYRRADRALYEAKQLRPTVPVLACI